RWARSQPPGPASGTAMELQRTRMAGTCPPVLAEPASDPLLCLPTEPIDTVSVRQMVEALTDRFDDHHGEIARILLSQMNCLTVQIDAHTTRIKQLVAAISTAGACTRRHCRWAC